jgi:hypothetical protein
MQKLSFDPTQDLVPVGMVTVNGMALTVHSRPAGPFGP